MCVTCAGLATLCSTDCSTTSGGGIADLRLEPPIRHQTDATPRLDRQRSWQGNRDDRPAGSAWLPMVAQETIATAANQPRPSTRDEPGPRRDSERQGTRIPKTRSSDSQRHEAGMTPRTERGGRMAPPEPGVGGERRATQARAWEGNGAPRKPGRGRGTTRHPSRTWEGNGACERHAMQGRALGRTRGAERDAGCRERGTGIGFVGWWQGADHSVGCRVGRCADATGARGASPWREVSR
ncbi:hypothetical protein FHR33_005732 [Nonomuraea dietziae]|uniref:Uncharacterized protein n=1 Tax=Nonomuraea dietziae TaxID=65515 RepID=A0A7W5VL48_9ACTN|nr:hypothetical protein [Nonomuraea dietziae]